MQTAQRIVLALSLLAAVPPDWNMLGPSKQPATVQSECDELRAENKQLRQQLAAASDPSSTYTGIVVRMADPRRSIVGVSVCPPCNNWCRDVFVKQDVKVGLTADNHFWIRQSDQPPYPRFEVYVDGKIQPKQTLIGYENDFDMARIMLAHPKLQERERQLWTNFLQRVGQPIEAPANRRLK